MERTAAGRSAPVFLGVDTHSDARVGVALDGAGRRLGVRSVPNTEAGYAELLSWTAGFGSLVAAGVEGTGSYGAGLSRFLGSRDARVLEVNRTSRQHRRRYGKHDAEAAARAVMVGTASGEPKGADGAAESLRALRVARRSAVKARTQAANQLHALVSTAPERPKAGLRGLPTKRPVEKTSRLRREAESVDPTAAARFALRSVARRHRGLSEEISELDAHIERLARGAAPELVALDGVGPDTASALPIAAGDNPERLRSEAAFAHLLCGAAPVPASSGKVVRHRLDPGGNRDALLRRYTWWRSTASGATSAPELTSPGAPPRARARRRPCGA